MLLVYLKVVEMLMDTRVIHGWYVRKTTFVIVVVHGRNGEEGVQDEAPLELVV